MAKGYVILTEAIKDPEGMKAYAQAAGSAMSGAKILAVDTAAKVIEGTWHGDQTVVLEFESVDAAKEWYYSDAYQEAAKIRQGAAECNGVIERFMRTRDPAEQLAAARRMAEIERTYVPTIPVIFRLENYFVQPWLTGFRPNRFDTYWKYLDVDPAKRPARKGS